MSELRIHTRLEERMPDCDWSAALHSYEVGDPIGRGKTEADAVYDLMQWLEEKAS